MQEIWGERMRKGKRIMELMSTFPHQNQDRRVVWSFLTHSLLGDQRSQMGSGGTPRCLAMAWTVPACPPSQEMDPGMVTQWEIPGPLTHSTLPSLENFWSFPTSFPCSCSVPDTPPDLTALWELIVPLAVVPMRAGYQRPVTSPFPGVSSLCAGKRSAGSGRFVNSAKSGFHFLCSSCCISNQPSV